MLLDVWKKRLDPDVAAANRSKNSANPRDSLKHALAVKSKQRFPQLNRAFCEVDTATGTSFGVIVAM
jgi:hypothetical protein